MQMTYECMRVTCGRHTSTYKRYMDNIRVHTSDIRMTYEYIRVAYGWYTSTCEWHTDGIRVYTSNIQMTYEFIRATYRWHTSKWKWHTDDIRVYTSDIPLHTSTYEGHTDDMRVHTSDISLHKSTYKWHTDDIRVYIDKIREDTSDIQTGPAKWISKWGVHGTLKSIVGHHSGGWEGRGGYAPPPTPPVSPALANDMGVHKSDIQITYVWHTSTYVWHTNDIRMA